MLDAEVQSEGVPDGGVQTEDIPDGGVQSDGVPVEGVQTEDIPGGGVQSDGDPFEDVNAEVETEGVRTEVDYVGQLHTTQETIALHAQYTSLNAHHSMVLNKLRKSERQIKLKISKPVYDKDGGGSSLDKPVRLDEA